jgi:CubicO group peptidase (beta-lactamase class C family)
MRLLELTMTLATVALAPRYEKHRRCATISVVKVTAHVAMVIALLVSLAAVHASPAHAAETVPADAAEVEAFLDGVVPDAMHQWHVPGAVILVVRDGTVLFEKGYGYADLAHQTEMSPERTVVRVFSLSKLLTATAVMQLVEQRKIELDKDVNAYLTKLHVGSPFGRPITIRHLLTHTAGFDSDQREIGGAAASSADWVSLDDYLARRTLAPMWPSGQQFLYTNAAYDLLGLVVQDVSGRPYADYMSERILGPLGMARSTFGQPPALESVVAVTYRYSDGQQTIVPQGLQLNVPAAGLTSTASDMAHFMISQLEGGQYGDVRVLDSATVREMQSQQFTYEPNQPGMTFGFREALSPRTSNGFRAEASRPNQVLWHNGGGPRAPTSYMQLQPGNRFGLFVYFNSDELGFLDHVLQRFNDHYDPPAEGANAAVLQQRSSPSPQQLNRFTGTYRLTDYSHNSIAKLLLLEDDDLPQVVSSADSLGIRWLLDAPDPPEPLVQVEPLVFMSQDGQFRFTFLQDDNNAITGMVWGNLFVLEKVPWYETVAFQRSLFAVFLLGFLTAALAWPVRAVGRRFLNRAEARNTHKCGSRIGLVGAFGVLAHGLLGSAFLLALLFVLPRAFDLGLQFGMPPALAALFSLPMLLTALAVLLVLLAIPILRNRRSSRLAGVAYCLYGAFAVAFVPFLVYWNLIGQRW